MSQANPNQAGMVRAQGRKRHNRALREEQLRDDAMQIGIPVRELKLRKFEDVQELRKYPPATPDWVNPFARERQRGW